MKQVFKEYPIKIVVHLAGLKSVKESMDYPEKYMNNNIIGSLNLIQNSLCSGVEKFIFSSSASVYGIPENSIPINEKCKTNPINYYGFTKLYIENYLNWISKNYSMKHVAFRYFNAAGYSNKIGSIRKKEKKPENLIPKVMKVANLEAKNIKVYGSDYQTKDGTCIRDYIHVLDLALAHVEAINYLEKNSSTTFNLSSGLGYSVLEVIKAIEVISGRKIKFTFEDRRKGDPPILISDFKKAKQLLGWEPIYNLNDIVESAWKVYSK